MPVGAVGGEIAFTETVVFTSFKPAFGEIARGFGAGALIFAAYGFFGFTLAAVFRATALAIGPGLA